MNKARIVVTGLGVISSIGVGRDAFWQALLKGQSGIRKISYFNTDKYDTHLGGEVTHFNPEQFMLPSLARRLGRGAQFALAAVQMALEDSRVSTDAIMSDRVAVCLGTTMADIQALEAINDVWVRHGDRKIPVRFIRQYPSFSLSAVIGAHFNFRGPNLMIPTACAAGNYGVGYAVDLLRRDRADIVIAGGVDPFSRIAFTGFNRIFAIAPEKCQPFDKNRRGTVIGEGAGILVLERLEQAKARNATVYAEVLGYGLSCDAHHMTIPDVQGIATVMRKALQDAGIDTRDVDYISAHGTGTPANDRAECTAIRNVFKEHADRLPVSSIKSMVGHTMGAASALETIACVMAVHQDHLPPTINFETPDPECPVDCVPNISRKQRVVIALNNSFAFGGNNACVVIGKYSSSER